MINQTITSTVGNQISSVSWEQWTGVSLSMPFLIAMGIIWILPLIIYLIIGACVKGGGKYYSKRMIEYPNFFYGFFLWFFFQSALILCLIVFPLWLKLFGGSS